MMESLDPPFLPGLAPLDDRPGPARRISRERTSSLITAALDQEASPFVPETRIRHPLSRYALAAAAALVLLSMAAAAFVFSPWRPWLRRQDAPTPLVQPAPIVSAKASSLEPPQPEKEPLQKEPLPGRRARTLQKAMAEDLLRRANEERRQRKWLAADKLYQQIIRGHDASPEGLRMASVARLSSASLHLEQLGDPKGALRLYKEAAAEHKKGSLAEEALYGMAESYRALADREHEVLMIRKFLKEHPESLHRGRFEARLRSLVEP